MHRKYSRIREVQCPGLKSGQCRPSATSLMSLALMSACLALLISTGSASNMTSRKEQEEYLTRFAYMGTKSPDPRFAEIKDPSEVFKMAVMKFQMMAGLQATGVVDEKTQEMMAMPRCGVADEVGMGMVAKRRRRRFAAQGSKWMKNRLTYRINDFTPDLPQATTREEIKTAFKMWRDVSPLDFDEVTQTSPRVDIDIGFYRGDHKDGSPFDGPSKTLAHAFFPQYGGDTHFDEDELWTSKTPQGINLLQVAIHEFGHSLGLEHSDVQDAIMAPFYRKYDPNVKLHPDDIRGIQYIYGSRQEMLSSTRRPSPPTRRPRPSRPSRICESPSVDAMFAVKEDIYVFKGDEYYKLDMQGVLPEYPRKISDDWPGLPGNLDTAVYRQNLIYFFKGDKYWRYNEEKLAQGGEQSISAGFRKAPNNISAAFVWSGNGRLYFIQGNQYYRISRNNSVDPGYPTHLRYWKGLPSKIDAAFNCTNMRTYFITGGQYYRFNDVRFGVDRGYPKQLSDWWMGCNLDNSMMDSEVMEGRDQFMAAGVQIVTTSSNLKLLASAAILVLLRAFM